MPRTSHPPILQLSDRSTVSLPSVFFLNPTSLLKFNKRGGRYSEKQNKHLLKHGVSAAENSATQNMKNFFCGGKYYFRCLQWSN